jgi:hypothetical protein
MPNQVVDFLTSLAGYARATTDTSADQPVRLAVIDPAYVVATGGPAKVTFEGESTMSTKSYYFVQSYFPVPGDRVLMLPVGTTYIIAGAVDNGSNFGPRLIAWAQATASGTPSAAKQLDVPVGNVAFTARSGRAYRLCYVGRAQATAAPATMDAFIVDGGASAPVATSTVLTNASIWLGAAGGAGSTALKVEQVFRCPTDLSAGVHTLAGVWSQTAGAATTVQMTQSSGAKRQLYVEDLGPNLFG